MCVLGAHLVHEAALAPVVHLVLHCLHLIRVIACASRYRPSSTLQHTEEVVATESSSSLSLVLCSLPHSQIQPYGQMPQNMALNLTRQRLKSTSNSSRKGSQYMAEDRPVTSA